MTTHQVNKKRETLVLKYRVPLALAALPVAVALYVSELDYAAIPTILSSGIFPITTTVLSWGLAAKLAYSLRQK